MTTLGLSPLNTPQPSKGLAGMLLRNAFIVPNIIETAIAQKKRGFPAETGESSANSCAEERRKKRRDH